MKDIKRHSDRFTDVLQVIIRLAVRTLAILMTVVIVLGVVAIARKIIILDVDKIEPTYLWGLASIVFAMSIGYWLVVVCPGRRPQGRQRENEEEDSSGEETESDEAIHHGGLG